jgi:hypothetical protein
VIRLAVEGDGAGLACAREGLCVGEVPGAALGPPYWEGGKPGPAADGSTLPWARSRKPAGLWRMVGEPGAASGLRYPENHLVRLGI